MWWDYWCDQRKKMTGLKTHRCLHTRTCMFFTLFFWLIKPCSRLPAHTTWQKCCVWNLQMINFEIQWNYTDVRRKTMFAYFHAPLSHTHIHRHTSSLRQGVHSGKKMQLSPPDCCRDLFLWFPQVTCWFTHPPQTPPSPSSPHHSSFSFFTLFPNSRAKMC